MSILSSLSDTGGRSPVDAWVANLAGLRDEGFRRVWMAQMPYDPDLTDRCSPSRCARSTRIEVGSGVYRSRFSIRRSWLSAR